MTRCLEILIVAVLSVLAAFLSPGTAFAKGPPVSVTIEGPGIAATTITDRNVLDAVGIGTLEVVASRSSSPPVDPARPFYLITRSWSPNVSDRLRYYPVDDGPSAVFYDK